ncbi:DMT family transporter [Bowmanella dokdonensis]|uniref:Guanidinium exporter n=1 Tax=Bowmanella dokdonensis TaxID=751969 RepID=A0A939DRP6_9ALTE|nr:SMR family transporter [Bowmanella dokdonensis]MBN7827438.1 QacE family quaternary ammonium compound efflux SMR transporter [Bowmanella dokdonensis]
MAWCYLTFASLFEILFALSLKHSDSFTHVGYSTMAVLNMFLSLLLLSVAMQTLPLALSYAVWTGAGIIGTSLTAMLWLNEAVNPLKLGGLVLIGLGILLLKLGEA